MSGSELIVQSRRIIASLLALLPCGVTAVCATSSDVKLPPGFTIKWNIAPKDSVVEQEFVVTENWWFRFDIKFSSTRPPGSFNPVEEVERMKQFAGSGTSSVVTKESANTDHPEVVIARTPEEVDRRDEGIRRGIYVWKATEPGVVVPVHLRIEHVNSSGATTVHTDEVVDTGNFYSAGSGGLFRKITIVNLKRGKYRVKASTIRDSSLLPDIETFLSAARDNR